MIQEEESNVFQVRLNDLGKKYIQKFAAISYIMLVLVIFGSVITVYWDIKILVMRASLSNNYRGFTRTLYDTAYPYISMIYSVLAVLANIYYLRFPGILLRSIIIKDEFGANQAFKSLFTGAIIFLLWLLLHSCTLIWSVVTRGGYY
jgi:hypothetical protein